MPEGSETVKERRKSARILALEEEKRNRQCNDNNVRENQTPVRRGRKRGRKRKRLEDVFHQQDSEDPTDEDNLINDDQAENLPSTKEEQEMCILEFILDTLQRKDAHKIFAKPVNPQEVWTYYRIIKEPMDFGTIRAKLQEGKYTSLELFEHDVNLVSANAMHFNSSTTVFYKEAQGIHELAQQLFRSLRANPEQFLSQCLLTTRGSQNRRPRPVGRPKSSRGPYIRKSNQAGSSNGNSPPRNSNVELERRDTYEPTNETCESLFSVVYKAAKVLSHKGDTDGNLGYKESLMKFVEDLGPTAQTVAERVLSQPLIERTHCQPQPTSIEPPHCQRQPPPVQTQTYMASSPAVLALQAPDIPGRLLRDNNGHHCSLYNFPNSYSNAPYFHGDASAQGYGRASINEIAPNGIMNPPRTSQFGISPNYHDKGKMVVDLNQNLELHGSGDTETRAHDQTENSKVQLESHIRVIRDFCSSGTLPSRKNFRAVDMLGKPNPVEYQQLQRATGTSNSIKLRNVDMFAKPHFLGRNTFLKPSSSLSHSPSPTLSSLSQASTIWNGSDSQLNDNNATSAHSGQQLHWSQPSTEAALELEESCSFLDMLNKGDHQLGKRTPLSKEQLLDADNYALRNNTFMGKEQLGEGSQWGNTSMGREQLFDVTNFQWGSSTYLRKGKMLEIEGTLQLGKSTPLRKEQHLDGSNFQLGSSIFLGKEHQLNGGNFLGSSTIVRKEEQLGGNFQSGNSTILTNENQLDESNYQLGNNTMMRTEQLDESSSQFGSTTIFRKDQQIDDDNCFLGRSTSMGKQQQVKEGNFLLRDGTFMTKEQPDEGSFLLRNGTFMSKEQLRDEGNFLLDNSTFMSKGLDEGSFPLGKNTFMRTDQLLDEVDRQWGNSTVVSKEQQLGEGNNQLENSTFLGKEQQFNDGNCQHLGKTTLMTNEQQPAVSSDHGTMPEWYNAISTSNERATTSSTQWNQREPTGQSLLSLLMDTPQPNLALEL